MPEKYNKQINTFPSVYATWFPELRNIAIEHGYALAIHGSMQRDFDLIAVPWIKKPKKAYDMIKAMAAFIEGEVQRQQLPKKGEKPHGRMAYVIVSYGGKYIDISVMPTLKERSRCGKFK